MKKCPFCAEEIQDEAVFCRWCKHDLHLKESNTVEKNAIQVPNNVKETLTQKPWGLGNWLLLLIGIGVFGLLGYLGYYGIKDQTTNSDITDPTRVVSSSSLTSTPLPTSSPILYSMNFTKNDGQWLEHDEGTQKIEISQGQYRISSYSVSTCPGSTTNIEFKNGILKVDLIRLSDTTKGASYSIMWRYEDVDNYYGIFITVNGEVVVYKVFKGAMSNLFLSKGSVIEIEKSVIPVHILFDGPDMQIFIDGKFITSIYDSSISVGGIGLALCAMDPENGATAIYDNLFVYSTTEKDKELPKQSQSAQTISGCKSWSDMTSQDFGKTLCVYGTVRNSYFDSNQNGYFITFSSDPGAIYFVSYSGRDYGDLVGKCVMFTGKVDQVWDTPLMQIGENDKLYDCGGAAYGVVSNNPTSGTSGSSDTSPTPIVISNPNLTPTNNPDINKSEITIKTSNKCAETVTVYFTGIMNLKFVVPPGKTVELQAARGTYTITDSFGNSWVQDLSVSVWEKTYCQ